MTDIIDFAWQLADEHAAAAIAAARVPIAPGQPGDCEDCGEYMPRLVDGQCGFCRDGRSPPPGWVPPVARPLTQEEPVMANGKSVMLPSSAIVAIQAVEDHARDGDMSLGQAAAALITRGLGASPNAGGTVDLASFDVELLIDELRARATSGRALAELRDANAALLARAEAAEAKVAQLRAALAD